MSLDWQLFHEMEAGLLEPTIRVYTWNEPGVTYGYLQDVKDVRRVIEANRGQETGVRSQERELAPVIASGAKQSLAGNSFREIASSMTPRNDGVVPIYPPDLARRPTGGGIVFHDIDEVVYCLVAPADSKLLPGKLTEAYLVISELICEGLNELGYPVSVSRLAKQGLQRSIRELCFAEAEEYEIVLGDKKIVGSAQRRTKNTILQQGTIKVGELVG
jgi:lipoate-protein ligase A